jgi:hypothetical protein
MFISACFAVICLKSQLKVKFSSHHGRPPSLLETVRKYRNWQCNRQSTYVYAAYVQRSLQAMQVETNACSTLLSNCNHEHLWLRILKNCWSWLYGALMLNCDMYRMCRIAELISVYLAMVYYRHASDTFLNSFRYW